MDNNAAGLPPIRDIIARHDILAQKHWGQNFLFDHQLALRIARASGDLKDVNVIEIGSGPGGLTRALLTHGTQHIYAVERDPRCINALHELSELYEGQLTVLASDALEVDLVELAPAPRAVIANLPYNISTKLLLKWLRKAHTLTAMTLMFQKEVANRITALPGSKAYGRLSVIVGWLTEARCLFDVPPQAFIPSPQVTSTLIRMVPRSEPLAVADAKALERVVAAGFGQRRKMLRRSLRSLGVNPVRLLAEAEVPETARAEDLDVSAFCALARAFERLSNQII